MSKVVNAIIIIILFIAFFEVGLFSSYTIVTSEVPNINDLISLQVNTIAGFFSQENINEVLIKDPTPVTITNNKETAIALENLTKVDGVNIDSMNFTTYNDTDDKEIYVFIEALGYSSPNSTSKQIIISSNPEYKIIATGKAIYKNGGFEIDPNSITINSILKLF